MPVIAVVIGALVGGLAAESLFGAAVGALLAFLLLRVLQHEREIATLKRRLAPAAAPVVPVEPVERSAEAVPPPVVEAALPPPAPIAAEPSRVSPAVSPAVAPRPAAPGAFAALLQRWVFGGNTIVKLGVGILFVGLAFLAKYASEHVHVPMEWRLSGIAAAALVLLGVGWRLRAKRPAYAQVLQGGAVAVWYLVLFVAFREFQLIGSVAAFALMVTVAALAAALAVLQDARALAVVGTLGGFATPLLVSTGSGNHVALFTYYAVLDVGIAAIAWYRTWRLLAAIGFGFTFGIGAAWGVLAYQPENYASSQAFLVFFFLLFAAILLLPARRAAGGDSARVQTWVNGGLLFGLPTLTFTLQHGLVHGTPFASAASALVLAAFYVLLALRLRARPGMTLVFEGSLGVAAVLLTLVVPLALDARSTAGAWALEGAGLVWIGGRQQRRLARAFGHALLLIAGFVLAAAHTQHARLQADAFNALLIAAAAIAAAFFARRPLVPAEAPAEPLLIGWGTLWSFVALAFTIDAAVPARLEAAAWLGGGAVIALAFCALAVRLAWPRAAWPALALPLAMALGALHALVTLAQPLADGGAVAWPLAFAVHVLLLRRLVPQWPAPLQRALHANGVLVLAALGALLGRAATAAWGDAGSAWPWLGWLAVPALLLALLMRPPQRWPVSARPEAYAGDAAAVLCAGLLLWTLLANIGSDGTAAPLPYVPLVNPLDLGIAGALFAAGRWLYGPAGRARTRSLAQAVPALLGGAAFVWLNAMLVRAFHHYGGVPYAFDAWSVSLAVQTGLALLWTVTALVLMWLAARRGWRAPWLAGAALLGLVVVKLLLVDLSGSGTVTRIVSFIGVGVLMLVIGYVAPLPTKAPAHATR